MNADQFFNLLNETDGSYLAAAHKSMTEKPARTWFRPTLIAACLMLVLLAIPVGIMIGNRTIKPSVPVITPNTTGHSTVTAAPPATTAPTTTQTPITTEKPKASVLDIPGATLFDEVDWSYSKPGSPHASSPTLSKEEQLEWLNQMKENNSIVMGYIKDYTSVLVPDGKDYYHIATMEIQVLENISGIEAQTIKAVYACRYEYLPYDTYKPRGTYQGTDSIASSADQFLEALNCTEAYKAQQGKCAGFILLKESKTETLTIAEESYCLSDYANYVLDASLGWDYTGRIGLRSFFGYYYKLHLDVLKQSFNKSFIKTYPYPYPTETPKSSNSIVTPFTTNQSSFDTLSPGS